MVKTTTSQAIIDHYAGSDMLVRIDDALARAGLDPQRVTVDDLAPLDEFHSAGRTATIHGSKALNPQPGMHIIDLGCGIGGAARYLAYHHDCHVTGIDLTPDYIRIADVLTKRTGLSDRCTFHTASATDVPLPDATFDAAISYHAAMNIEDRAAFYREAARLLKPGAAFLTYDVMQNAPGLDFPAPWASTADESFLKSPDETRKLMEDAGFGVEWTDSFRDTALAAFRKTAQQIRDGNPPKLTLAPLTGGTTKQKFGNYTKAIAEGLVEPMFIYASVKRT